MDGATFGMNTCGITSFKSQIISLLSDVNCEGISDVSCYGIFSTCVTGRVQIIPHVLEIDAIFQKKMS